mgnify:CR=1 FL=1
MQIVCSQCLSANRVAESRLGEGPVCGKCKTVLLPATAIELNDATFSKFVKRSDVPVASGFGISGIPTMIVFQRGRELNRQSGAMSTSQIVQWVRQHSV